MFNPSKSSAVYLAALKIMFLIIRFLITVNGLKYLSYTIYKFGKII